MGQVTSVTTTQLCRCSVPAPVDNRYTNEYGRALCFLTLDAEILIGEIFMYCEVLLLIF